MKATITIHQSEGRPRVAAVRWFAKVSNIAACGGNMNSPQYRSVNDWFPSREEAQEWAEKKAKELGWSIES